MQGGIFDTCITSPPYYGLRNYGVAGQIGLEETPEEYVQRLVVVFREVRRVLKDDGTLWLNIGDSYATGTKAKRQQSKNPGVGANRPEAQNGVPRIGTPKGCKTKDLIGIPWLLAFALREDGWYLRQDIIWNKVNAMPESVKDRCVKSHEYIFLLSKSQKYYFDEMAMKEPAKYDGRKATANRGSEKYKNCEIPGKDIHGFAAGEHERWQWIDGEPMRNRRSVWSIPTSQFKGAHFATFPPNLIRPCILAGSRKGGAVLDPFSGSGTTAYVAVQEGRNATGIELNPEYVELSKKTIESQTSQTNIAQFI